MIGQVKFSDNSRDDWSRAVVDGIDRLCHDGGVRDPEGSRNLVAATRSRVRASAEMQQQAAALPETESQDAPVHQEALRRPTKAKAKACSRGKESSEVITFRGSPPPDPHSKWIGQQDEKEIPSGGVCLKLHPDFQTDSWWSKTTRDLDESSFQWNNESVSSSKNTSLCSTSDRKELLALWSSVTTGTR